MSGPPNVEPSELWMALEKRPRPSKLIPFPVRAGEESPGQLALVVLTESERHQARANAGAVARELCPGASPNDAAYLDVYRSELAIQLVVLACRNPKDEQLRFSTFPTAKHARQVLTTDEFTQLALAYDQFRTECGPVISELTPDECEAWLKALTEGAGRVPLVQHSGEALIDLVMFLVSRIQSMGISSAGSPPDASRLELKPPSVSELLDDAERPTLEG